MKYAHIANAVFGTPWMIRDDILDVIVDMLTFRMEGGRLSPDEIQLRIDAAGPRQRQQASAAPGVAVLQLYGVIAPRASMLSETSTQGTGLDAFMQTFRAQMADPEIGSIVLDIDSPGGQVGGVPEAAAEIRAARSVKPITAFANVAIGAASAAYYLGSQAGEFVASPSSEVGSIGVRAVHLDKSKFYEDQGVRHTVISAGKYKSEGSPYGPLSEDTLAWAQGQVNTVYQDFLADVAKGRNVPVSKVKSDFGEGRMLLAKDALAVGMIDRIDTLDGVLRQELARPTKSRQVAALGPAWTINTGTASGTINVVLETAPEPEASAEAKPDVSFEVELRRRRVAVR